MYRLIAGEGNKILDRQRALVRRWLEEANTTLCRAVYTGGEATAWYRLNKKSEEWSKEIAAIEGVTNQGLGDHFAKVGKLECSVATVYWWVAAELKRDIEDHKRNEFVKPTAALIDTMSGLEFEHFVAHVFRNLGWSVHANTVQW